MSQILHVTKPIQRHKKTMRYLDCHFYLNPVSFRLNQSKKFIENKIVSCMERLQTKAKIWYKFI